jgi:CheY-like chemotaxis protein
MAGANTRTVTVASGDEALAELAKEKFDCVVLDLGLPGLSGWRVIEELQANQELRSTPVVVYTGRDLTRKEEIKLGKAAKSIVIKDARSPERLKQEISSILQGAAEDSRTEKTEDSTNGAEPVAHEELAGKKVLVVDDDIRNIFALTAMLERQRMEVVSVDSGQEALQLLEQPNDIDIALVDVMMPEMDGYATMSKMRELKTFDDRPIIALTAKAMKGDREKCIEAGASDYIAKPVNNEHLLSMLTSWLAQ